MASPQRLPTPPPEVFDKNIAAHHLRGLAHQVTLFEAESLNQDALAQTLAAVRGYSARMEEMKTEITDRINNMETAITKRLDKLESFAINTKAQAKNAHARELGVNYTPLVKDDGSAIRGFPPTLHAVNALNDPHLSTLLRAVGVEPDAGWNLEQKRSAFLGAIGVMQSPNI